MNKVVIDYNRLQFLLYKDENLVKNPLPAEFQAILIKETVTAVAEEVRQIIRNQLSDKPPRLWNEKNPE